MDTQETTMRSARWWAEVMRLFGLRGSVLTDLKDCDAAPASGHDVDGDPSPPQPSQ